MNSKIISGLLLMALASCATTPKVDTLPDFSWVGGKAADLSWANEVGSHLHPTGDTLYVSAFGAVADSTLNSTHAIQTAIDSCAAHGGGVVCFEPGVYQTGALFVKSGVNLHIGKEVTLLAAVGEEYYPEFPSRVAGVEMTWPSAVINMVDVEQAALSGEGRIDCRGTWCWDKYWAMRKDYTPRGLRWIVDYDCKRIRGILVENSKNVSLTDFTLMRTGFWGIQVLYSEHCTLSGLTIDNNIGGHGPSTDGIDIDSSRFILVEHCEVDCNDDNICLKAGRDADGLRVNRPTEYVVIRNCTARKGAGLITCGSETSGSIRYVLGYDLHAVGTSSALRMKSAMNRGGVVEYIYVSNVTADSVRNVLAADLNWNPSYSYSKLPAVYEGKEIPSHWHTMLTPVEPIEKGWPHFRHVYMQHVKARGAGQFITAAGANDSLRLEDYHLRHFDVEADKAGNITFTENFSLKNIRLQTADGSRVTESDNNKLQIEYEATK